MQPSLDVLRLFIGEQPIFLRGEAIDLGIDDDQLRRGCKSGLLVRVQHGIYAFGDPWRDLNEEGRHRLRAQAAARRFGSGVAFTHHTASLQHGMELWGAPLDLLHATRIDSGSSRTASGVVHHVGAIGPDDVVVVDGLTVTVPARAALESASLLDVERGLCVVNSGLSEGLFTKAELALQLAAHASWPGTRHLRLVESLSDRGCTSIGESRTHYLMWASGLPRPVLQFKVFDGGRLIATVDFAWPEFKLIIEFDGKVKYGALLRDGEKPEDALFREKRREDAIRRVTGWRVLRLTWPDLQRPHQTAALIRSVMSAAA